MTRTGRRDRRGAHLSESQIRERPQATLRVKLSTYLAALAVGASGAAAIIGVGLAAGQEPSSREVGLSSIAAPLSNARPGIGLTEDQSICDVQGLYTDLQADPTKAQAWAAVMSIDPAALPNLLAELSPTVLSSNVAVTGHHYSDGKFVAVPTVLPAGTAVFVDRSDRPTARCFTGEPLTPAATESRAPRPAPALVPAPQSPKPLPGSVPAPDWKQGPGGGDKKPGEGGKGTGTGLVAQYFNNIALSGNPVATVNQAVDFDWGTGAPRAGVNANVFSVRWSGMLEPQATGTYRFQTVSDDGVRLWVNGVQLNNDWTLHSSKTTTTAEINLVAGQRYSIRMEYYENQGSAVARLRWLTPGNDKIVAIPVDRLYQN